MNQVWRLILLGALTLACVAIAILWPLSWWPDANGSPHGFAFWIGRTANVRTGFGRLIIKGPSTARPWGPWSPSYDAWESRILGLDWLNNYTDSSPYWELHIYYRTLMILFAPYPTVVGIRYCFARFSRARRRLEQGLCLHCGYDLRASRDRCPECGSPIGNCLPFHVRSGEEFSGFRGSRDG